MRTENELRRLLREYSAEESSSTLDWCYLLPYCSELQEFERNMSEEERREPLVNTNTTQCFFVSNVSWWR